MKDLTTDEKQALLKLARSSIAARFHESPSKPKPEVDSPLFSEKRGCFVTLQKSGTLRGCIGIIEPVKPLADAVADSAVNAAFKDPRFPPVTADELEAVEIEISVLSVPEVLEYDGADDLLDKLNPYEHGVIIAKDSRRSTFLPQVWDQLPNKKSFLSHLCGKAGLKTKEWQSGSLEVQTYHVIKFTERDFS